MASSAAELKVKYGKILKENGIDDEIAQVTVTKPDLKGQHMASVIETARIDFENGNRPPLNLFLKKLLPPSGIPLMDDAMKDIMVKEGTFLTDFSKELNELSKERAKGSASLTGDLFPKTYYYDKEIIVMEDLTKQGYCILSKHDKQDFKDASTAVRHLAKLHALSFVLIEHAGGSKNFLESHPYFKEQWTTPEGKAMMSQAFEPGYNMALEVLMSSTNEEKDKIYELLAKYKGKIVDQIAEAIETDSIFKCVLHGDFWNNNMMFNETREKMVFVDFQIARVGSPNLDLSYFLFTSTRSEVRKRWKELLQVYFDSLKSNVESLGQTFEFNFEDFAQDFIRKSKIGFFVGFFLILGMEAMGGHDTSNASSDLLAVFTTIVRKWVEENPDKSQAASESMVSMTNDYLLFGQL